MGLPSVDTVEVKNTAAGELAISCKETEDMETARVAKLPVFSYIAPVYVHRIVRDFTLLCLATFVVTSA